VPTIFDIGMFDGLDTDYYLECGYRVVAVEANPDLAARARSMRAEQVAAGVLVVIYAAMTASHEPVALHLSGRDLGSSSLDPAMVEHKQPAGSVSVPGITLADLFERHGVPHFMKVDIEGADRACVLALAAGAVPRYLSFEIGSDFEELLGHLRAVGYRRFKIVSQMSFRELANCECLRDRIGRRVARQLGRPKATYIRRAGRMFASGHSSGPVPWRSDGRWRTYEQAVAGWRAARDGPARSGWYDLLATTG
jgi:FkbM family methyltransferase